MLLFVTALIVRVVFWLFFPSPYHGLIRGEMVSDAVEYDIIARNLVSGGGFGYYSGVPTAFRNPVTPFLGALVYLLTGPNPAAVQILMLIIGSLIPPVLYVLARQYIEPASALLAGAIAVFYPSLVTFSTAFMTEVPFALLILLALLCWNRFTMTTRGGWGIIVNGSVFMGLALLTRSTPGPLLLLWILYLIVDGGRERWKHLLRFAVYCGIAFLVILPWCVRNHAIFGQWSWVATNGGYTIWQRYNHLPPDGTIDSRKDVQQELQRIYNTINTRIDAGYEPADAFRPYMAQTVRGYLLRLGPEEADYIHSFDGLNEAQIDRRLFREAIAVMFEYPRRTAIKLVKNIIKYWEPYYDPDLNHRVRRYYLAYGIMAPFMLWGLILSVPQRRRFMILYITIFGFWLTSAIALHQIRYRLPVECIGLIFASVAVITLFRRPGKPWLPWVIIGIVVSMNIVIMLFGGPFFHNIREAIHAIN